MGGDDGTTRIEARDLTVGFGDVVVLHDVSFEVRRGSIFFIIGGSGSGKSTLLRNMLGLDEPKRGEVLYDGVSFTRASLAERERMRRGFGVLYQGGALWSSMTLAENVGLPLGEFTDLSPREIDEVVSMKLALVGLKGFEDHFPSEISGGMMRRAGLARAMALDPDILFLDEPSAGLDPITSELLDELIVALRDTLGATVVIVSHELASIMSIGDDAIFLDAGARTIGAQGPPRALRDHAENEAVRRFLSRGVESAGVGAA
jgi:phospholipid/cholesterol/gamma-HCH transport system ATP-binding protein